MTFLCLFVCCLQESSQSHEAPSPWKLTEQPPEAIDRVNQGGFRCFGG